MPSTALAIPQFDLYGDQTRYEHLGFVHIEDIADRSHKNNWLIKPHRHGKMLQILFIYSGQTRVQIDDSEYEFDGGRIVTIPPGVVHGFKFQPGTDGKVLTVAEPVFNAEIFKTCKDYFEPIIAKPAVIELERANGLFDQIQNHIESLESELNRPDLGQELMLEWLLNIVLLTVRRQVEHANFKTLSGTGHGDLFANFQTLLEEHYRKQWTVKHYTDALHTSYSTLNRVCKETAGLPAKDLILNRMLIAAKRQLIYTQAPLDQIAHRLGFKDPAYFSRIFKKRTSQSPTAYRKQKFELYHTVHES